MRRGSLSSLSRVIKSVVMNRRIVVNPVVKYLYGLDEFYGEDGCCLTCSREKKKDGCLCFDMKCKKYIYYIPAKYASNYGRGHCGYGDISDAK
jgi:hypothetical protein